ncbi:MAG: HAD family hydrolase [Planctomycetota bacterium]
MRQAVFLDRDGVINVFPGKDKFVLCWEEFHFKPDVAEQLCRLRAAGFRLALITNQSGVGRGLMTLDALNDIHRRMQAALGKDALDAIYFCAHHPDNRCTCRKPSPELIRRACVDMNLDLSASVVVGDSMRDIEMGHAAGCRTILCRENLPPFKKLKPMQRPDQMAQTLTQATDWILSTVLRRTQSTGARKTRGVR